MTCQLSTKTLMSPSGECHIALPGRFDVPDDLPYPPPHAPTHPHHRRRPRRERGGVADRGRRLPVVLHEMRPHRQTEAHKTDGLAELVCSNSFRSDDAADQRGGPAARGDAPRGLADHGGRRCPQAPGRRRAGGRPRSFLRRGDAPARRASPVTIERGEVAGLPPADVGQRHHRHRAAHLAGAVRRHPAAHRRDRARLLRRHRPHRASRLHRRDASPGASRATTSRAPPAPAPTTSTAR